MKKLKASDFSDVADEIASKALPLVQSNDIAGIVGLLAPYFDQELIEELDLNMIFKSVSKENQANHKREITDHIKRALLAKTPDLQLTPHLLETKAQNFRRDNLRSLTDLATSLIEEATVSMPVGDLDDAVISHILSKMLLSYKLYEQTMIEDSESTIEESVRNFIDRNPIFLDTLTAFLEEEKQKHGEKYDGVETDARLLMWMQPTLFKGITDNDTLITGDFNYRHGSDYNNDNFRPLSSPYLGDTQPELRYNSLRPTTLTPPTNHKSINGLSSAFGFFRIKYTDPRGNFYLKERPFVSVPNSIWEKDSPASNAFIRFNRKFPFVHDLLHHLVPVYSDSFILAPLGSAVAPKGRESYDDDYVTFGQSTRGFDNEYEEILSVIQLQLWQRIYEEHPELEEKHLELVELTIDDIANDEQLSLEEKNYMAAVVIHRAMRVFDFDSPKMQPTINRINKHTNLSYRITAEEVVDVLRKENLIALTPEEMDGMQPAQILSHASLSAPNALEGSEHVFAMLENTAILPWNPQEETKQVKVFDGLRFQATQWAYYAEKIHHKANFRYGPRSEPFERINPLEVVLKQTQAFQQNAGLYQKRKKVLSDTTKIMKSCHELVNVDNKNAALIKLHRRYRNTEHAEIIKNMITTVDRVADSMLARDYPAFSESEWSDIRAFFHATENSEIVISDKLRDNLEKMVVRYESLTKYVEVNSAYDLHDIEKVKVADSTISSKELFRPINRRKHLSTRAPGLLLVTQNRGRLSYLQNKFATLLAVHSEGISSTGKNLIERVGGVFDGDNRSLITNEMAEKLVEISYSEKDHTEISARDFAEVTLMYLVDNSCETLQPDILEKLKVHLDIQRENTECGVFRIAEMALGQTMEEMKKKRLGLGDCKSESVHL